MKKIALILACLLLFCGCTVEKEPQQKQYTATFLELFDTVTTIVGRADNEEHLKEMVQPIRDELDRYNKLFDIYEEYEGINNLKTVNDMAGIAPVEVDSEIIELLSESLEYYRLTNGVFNPAMGAVLSIWHEAREDGLNDPENAYLPDREELEYAALHIDAENIILDVENSTVFFDDPELKLDVGAIAKGWAVQRACENAPSGLLVSVGGNVYATGPKDENNTPWAVGIQNPNGEDYLHILNITGGSVVTSGSYQRNYVVDNKLYHHIIDPETLYPSECYTSVTIVCDNSGLADMLSTSLFILDREEGESLLEQFDACAMWVDTEGNKYYSSDFSELIRN